CSASYFVPKPHTPFQWCAQEDIDSIKRKQRMLKEMGRRYRIDVKVHHAETSLLEGVISRGDRNLCKVIERAWREGCRFDGWTDHFDFAKWMQAFKDEGVEIEPYLRELPVREFDKPGAPLVQMVWDHLDTLVKREFNAREYTKGIKAKISPPCELPVKVIDGRPTAIAPSHEDFERVASQPLLCYACGLECDLTVSREHLKKAYAMHEEVRTYQQRIESVQELIDRPLVQLLSANGDVGSDDADFKSQISNLKFENSDDADFKSQISNLKFKNSDNPTPSLQPPAFRYRATFAKGEQVKYLSHLDLTRALPRAFRRAKIKLGYSRGFHPMPLIQYGPALGVGTVGENELIDFDSPDELDESGFLDRINAVLPEGLRFNSIERLSANAQSLIKDVNRAEYAVALDLAEIAAALKRIRADRPRLADSDDDEVHNTLAEDFLARESCVIERVRKDKRQKVDVRRYTRRLRYHSERRGLEIITEVSPNGGVKPIEVLAAVYGLELGEMLALSSRVRRVRLFAEVATTPATQSSQEPNAARMSVL
ncbi:MAG TPA: TIGR03936 family radical SAM-associated protein, partial [Blastocatellia bacterium]|nr:TIGR03936 family radical SAM-associated protein [Blastocatellia bacterium]